MSARPTPPPWTVRARRLPYKRDDGTAVQTVVQLDVVHGSDVVCGVHVRGDEDRALANAALLSAAHEMREALRKFVDRHPCRYDHGGACQEHGQGAGDDVCPNVAALAALAKAEERA